MSAHSSFFCHRGCRGGILNVVTTQETLNQKIPCKGVRWEAVATTTEWEAVASRRSVETNTRL